MEQDKNILVQQANVYANKIHFLGRLTVLMALTGFIGMPLLMGVLTNNSIDWGIVASGCLAVLPTFAVAAVSENLAYCPMIGPGALYISCITGNLSNMKLPSCVNAMELAGVEPGSEKGDILSILAVCSSTVVTVLVVFLGMLFLAPLFEPVYNNPVLQPAFTNLMPAMMGALLIPRIPQSLADSIVPVILPIIAIFVLGRGFYAFNQSYVMIAVMLASILASYFLHKNELKSLG